MLSSVSISKMEIYDELDVRNKPELRNLLEVEEKVLFSGILSKINKHSASQERMLVITNKHIYNIQPDANLLTKLTFFIAPQSSVKRKIPISKVWGATISTSHLSEQFVIHVDGDYDYLYDGKDKREKVLKSLCNAYFKAVSKQFPLYIRNEVDMSTFQTTDDDIKAGVDKKPKEGKIYVTRDILEKGLVWIIQNRNDLAMAESRNRGVTSNDVKNTNSQFGNNFQQQQQQSQMQRSVDFRQNPQSQFPMPNQQGSVFQGPNPPYQLPNNNQGSFPQRPIPPTQNSSQFNGNYQNQDGRFLQKQSYSMDVNQNNYQQNQPNTPTYNHSNTMPQEKKVESNTVSANKVMNYNGLFDYIRADYKPMNQNVNVNFDQSYSSSNNNGNMNVNSFGNENYNSRQHLPY